MRKIICLAAIVFVLSMSVTALAGSEIPDLKGEWVMKAQSVIHSKTDAMQPKRHVDVRKGHADIDFILTIDKQDGFRFSGVKSSKKRKETVSGVIGFDNKSVYMVDDDGIMLCRIVGPDKMEQIYLHITEHRSVANRAIMTRKR